MTDDLINLAKERAERLARKRQEIMALPTDRIVDRILDEQHPAALVHSFPEQDFYFLIHEIGIHDSMELLALASIRQWEYIMDIEVWERDRMRIPSISQWLNRLLQADPKRLIRWCVEEQKELTEWYLFNNIEVFIREHDQDPSDFGDDVFTLDDKFYIRIKGLDGESEEFDDPDREDFLAEFFERLADYDYRTYQNILLESASIIPAETEEESYRLRNVRLAEKGFVPFDEAIGIYQALKPETVKYGSRKYLEPSDRFESYLPVAITPSGMLDHDDLFTCSLKTISDDSVLRQLQSEFAGLCNHLISADQKIIREKAELKSVVRKASGYLSLGLEQLIIAERKTPKTKTGKKRKAEITAGAKFIQEVPLNHIFRVGYGLALELKWQAQKWQRQSWFAKERLSLSFWGEEWMGVIGGLLIAKPLFYNHYRSGLLYREFASSDDIAQTRQILNDVMAVDRLLSAMNIKPRRIPGHHLTYKNLLLTVWARQQLALSDELSPIPLEPFKAFFSQLLLHSDNPGIIPVDLKESFLQWLSEKSGVSSVEISQSMGAALETLFKEIETEYGPVSPANLDPKHVHLFLLT